MKNFRLTTKLFLAIALLFAVVMRAGAEKTVLYEGSGTITWDGTYVDATTITATTGLTLHITIETTADAWWQFKMCQAVDSWPVIQLNGNDYVNSNNASSTYNATAGTYTYDFELTDDQITKLKSGVYFQGSIGSGNLILKKVLVESSDSGSGSEGESGSSESGSESGSSTTETTFDVGVNAEAENAKYSGTGCSIKTTAEATEALNNNNPSVTFSGSFSNDKGIYMTDGGDQLTFKFNVVTAGKYNVVIKAVGMQDNKTVNCSVNSSSYTFTAENNVLKEETVGPLTLSAGTTTVTIKPSWTYFYIDYVRIEAAVDPGVLWSDNLKLEAEDADGYVTASGSGCSQETLSDCTAIQMTDASDLLAFRFNIPEDGKYKVYVRAQGNGGAKVANISINGTTAMFETPESIAEVEAGEFNLSAGQTTVTISPSWTYYYIDYVKLELDDKSLFFNISKTPVTSGATQAALNLYSFLYNNFGAKTISGVMTGDLQVNGSYVTQLADQLDVKAVVTASGKTPQLVGFDFMNATGKGYDSDENYTNTALTLATELWNKGGIPTFTWHWRDPSRTTDSFYKDNGFDFTTAMSNGSWNTSSEVYTKMIADIDKVAAYFKTLENAGVACIFRPLHEPSNGGFWWGAKGAANYVKLYQLIYNEMVNVKGVKNVIWDWNSYYYASSDWCPGSSYYDVASTDIYNSANDNESNYVAFNKMKEQTGATKLLALAECGPIPDITNQVNDEAMWSYWMTWYDTWDKGYVTNYTTSAEWTKVMADDHIIEKSDVSSLANNIVLVDGTAYTATSDQVASSISYTRSCSNEWGTLCLPFAYSSNDDVQYYSLKSGTGSTLVVSSVSSVSAGQPVLFHMLCAEDANSKYQLKVSATNTTVTKASSIQTATPVDGWSIKGTYAGTTIQNSGSTYEYYIASNKFWYADNSVTVPAYRAWVEGVSLSSSQSKALTIVIDDDPIEVIPTEIECLQNNTIENVSMNIYNLNGQHLSAPQKGINIINGKKILVK